MMKSIYVIAIGVVLIVAVIVGVQLTDRDDTTIEEVPPYQQKIDTKNLNIPLNVDCGASCTQLNCVDFAITESEIITQYGTNEGSTWHSFAVAPELKQYAKDTGTELVRVWVSAEWYRKYWNHYGESYLTWTGYTYPLQADGSYNWENLDLLVDSVLEIDAIPIILLAHGDVCGQNGAHPEPFDFDGGRCEAFGTVMPSSINGYAQYAKTVTQHLVDRYGHSKVNTWYFEIMNEPFGFSNWDPDYYNLYNAAELQIKFVVPNAKVGGYNYEGTSDFISKCSPDFIDLHLYPNNIKTIYDDNGRMEAIDGIKEKIEDAKRSAGTVEIFSGEYNIDVMNGPYLNDRPFIGAWWISILINEVETQVNAELSYKGTCGIQSGSGCMGLWTKDGTKLEGYYAKKAFTSINPRGAMMYFSRDDSGFDVLGTEYLGEKHITVVNKKGYAQTLKLQIANGGGNIINVDDSSEKYTEEIVNIPLDGYEYKLFEVER